MTALYRWILGFLLIPRSGATFDSGRPGVSGDAGWINGLRALVSLESLLPVMSNSDAPRDAQRLLDSAEQAGTAPEDRRFRPDVQGLRAVAVLLVVLSHFQVPYVAGGYVGVDVFFVISGFVITGLLLRERQGTGRTSVLDFYARRCRRILPAATLMILVTVLAAYALAGRRIGANTADDGRWSAAFLVNFHFAAVAAKPLGYLRPISPLGNLWSLSVEEQFYLVFPSLFLLVANAKSRFSLRSRLVVTLVAVIVASYSLSIFEATTSHQSLAYYSPFTRAWELALGALVAVSTSWLKRVPKPLAAGLTWAGLVAIIFSAVAFTQQTKWPGSLVALPVLGATATIAGGVVVPRFGAESVLGLHPFRSLGNLSYSLYLWHWPVLIIAGESVGYRIDGSSPWVGKLLLAALALALSWVTYRFVENPIRQWRVPSSLAVRLGVGSAITTILILTLAIALTR